MLRIKSCPFCWHSTKHASRVKFGKKNGRKGFQVCLNDACHMFMQEQPTIGCPDHEIEGFNIPELFDYSIPSRHAKQIRKLFAPFKKAIQDGVRRNNIKEPKV